MHVREHLRTVGRHRRLVRHYCLRLGLVWQGLTHDLSKYSPTEFWRSAKYYQGYRSPNDQERLENGVSLSWLHHKGRNRHHFEYWIDYCLRPDGSVYMGGCKMPKRYVAEMFCDRIAACRVYQGEKYTDASPYDYYQELQGPHSHQPGDQRPAGPVAAAAEGAGRGCGPAPDPPGAEGPGILRERTPGRGTARSASLCGGAGLGSPYGESCHRR